MTHRVKNIIEYQETLIQNEKLKQKCEQIYPTTRDNLTGLYNRFAFSEEVRSKIKEKPKNSYILFCLDIDSFKIINDKFGYDEGDRLLKFIADTRSAEVNEVGGIACRDMADIFLTLLPNDQSEIDRITEHFLNCINNYNLPVNVNVHIGRYACGRL